MQKIFYVFLSILIILLSFETSQSQVVNGDAVVTCYSGGSSSGFVAAITSVQNASLQTLNANWAAPMNHGSGANQFTKQNLGEVFGICFDASGNFYLSATTVYSASTPGGPGGAGAIYKVNGVTGMISVFVGTLNAACGSVVGTNTLPNTGSGLGNIAYDAANDQFFVTNMEDGKIYRIDNAGIIQSSFDPFSPDGCVSLHAPAGERVWGIGVYNDRVYFGRWNEDQGTPSALVANEVWSIQLDGSGEFIPATVQLEITVPTLPGKIYSNPVADIAFSQAGRMLIAERSMVAFSNNPFYPSAHQSRVLEYELTSGWTPTGNIFKVGVLNDGSNSAGGVDYTYGSFDQQKKVPVDCDHSIWATGDYLQYTPDFIYGMQMLPATGGDVTNSVLVDFDGDLVNGQKTQIGDVEVYKICAVDQPPCEQITYKINYIQMADGTGCCPSISLNVGSAGLFTTIEANVLTSGVTITGVTGPYGWGVTNSGTMATWSPLSGTIPAGSIDSLIFCLFSLAPPMQQVEIVAYGVDGSTCRDTIRIDCPQQQPPVPVCYTVDTSDIECAEINNGNYTFDYSLQITNNSPFSNAPFNLPAENVLLYPITGGLTITPNSSSFPPLGYGATSGWLNFSLSGPGAIPGSLICFVMQLHGAAYQDDYQWCCPPDTICIRLPECKECCDEFMSKIETEKITVGSNGLLNLSLNVTTNPSEIISASATVVSAAYKGFGLSTSCAPTNWTQASGYVNNAPSNWNGLPQITTPQPFTSTPPGPYDEVSWGIVPAGVTMSGTPLTLQLKFPPQPSSFVCKDSLRFCVRYSFTDTNCVTCDTLICYEVIRNGQIIIHDGDVGIGKIEFAKIRMKQDKTGELIFNIPELDSEADPDDEFVITGYSLESETGLEIKSIMDAQGNNAEFQDRKALMTVTMNQGKTYTADVVWGDTPHTLWRNELTVQYYRVGTGPKDIFTSSGTIWSRVPSENGSAVDSLVESDDRPEDVRTFVLYIRNANPNSENIKSITVQTKDGERILAAGRIGKDRLHLTPMMTMDGELVFSPQVPEGAEIVEMEADSVYMPLYITVAGVVDSTITLSYTTYNSVGDIITESEVTLHDPLLGIFDGGGSDDPNSTIQGSVRNFSVYPNPAADKATVQFTAERNLGSADLELIDASGRSIRQIFSRNNIAAGNYALILDTSDLPSGTYYCYLKADDKSVTKIITVVR